MHEFSHDPKTTHVMTAAGQSTQGYAHAFVENKAWLDLWCQRRGTLHICMCAGGGAA